MKRDCRLLLPLFLVQLVAHLALPGHAAAEGVMGSGSGSGISRRDTMSCKLEDYLGQPRTGCGEVRVDIIYVIDSSNSVAHQDFDRAKDIIVQLVDFFSEDDVPFDSKNVRLAIIQFGSAVRTDLTFEVSASFGKNYKGLVDRIKGIKRMTGLETNTAKGLEEATQYFQTNERKNAEKYTIVITDGQCSQRYLSRLETAAADLRGGSHVWGIGVGNTDMEELKMISGHGNAVLHIENFQMIAAVKEFFHKKIVTKWRTKFCYKPGKCGGVRADIVIVIDTSNSISYGDFDRAKDFITEEFLKFFDEEKIPFSSDSCRLSVIQYGEQVKTELTFEESSKFKSNYKSLKERIQRIKRIEGLETNTAKALERADQILEIDGRPKVAIVITDGHCSVQYLDALYNNAKELRDGEGMEKRMVMGIGVGKADFKELEHITGDQQLVKNISDFKQSREVRKFFNQKLISNWRKNGGCQHCCCPNGKCCCAAGYQLADDGIHCHLPPANPSPCGRVRADVLFVIDSSNSISPQDFEKAKLFIVNFLEFFSQEKIPFSSDDSRLAVIQFGKQVRTDLTFEESTKIKSNYASLEERIKSIKRMLGTETNTGKALEKAAQLFKENERVDAVKHTIVITDGQCTRTYLSDMYANAAALRGGKGRFDQHVWGIGVRNADLNELEYITGDRAKVLSISDFERINEVKEFFHKKVQSDWRAKGACEHFCTKDRVCGCYPGYQLIGKGFKCDPIRQEAPRIRSGYSTSSAASSFSSYLEQFWPSLVLRLVFSTLPAWIIF